jgi:hypothetical protein
MDTKNKRKMHYIDDTKDFFAGPELEHKHLDIFFQLPWSGQQPAAFRIGTALGLENVEEEQEDLCRLMNTYIGLCSAKKRDCGFCLHFFIELTVSTPILQAGL